MALAQSILNGANAAYALIAAKTNTTVMGRTAVNLAVICRTGELCAARPATAAIGLRVSAG